MSSPGCQLDAAAEDALTPEDRAWLEAEVERRVRARIADLEDLNTRLNHALDQKSQAEEAAARSEAHFRADFEAAAVGKVHYDPKTGRIIRANKAHAAMLGYEPHELVGRVQSEFVFPEDRDNSRYRRLVGGEFETYSREKRYLRRNGTPVWGRVSATLIRDPETGEPLLTVAVIEDVDDRHKAQMALAEANAELEAVVAERTAALAQRDLLLREVYHRVKNNLQVVDGLLLMQSRRLSDPEARDALENLRSRVFALGLVHHQLMGSKDLETFDIAPFLQELSRHLVEGAGGSGIKLSVDAAPLRVGLDFAIPLGLLVTELMTNSIKHGFADGEGSIAVVLEAAGPGRLELRVTDDGVGYDPAQATSSASLGAVIIEGLVQQLKGELSVTRNGGAHAVVSLPAPQ